MPSEKSMPYADCLRALRERFPRETFSIDIETWARMDGTVEVSWRLWSRKVGVRAPTAEGLIAAVDRAIRGDPPCTAPEDIGVVEAVQQEELGVGAAAAVRS